MSAKVRGQNDRPGKRRPRTARTRAESDDEEELSGIVVRRSQRRGGARRPMSATTRRRGGDSSSRKVRKKDLPMALRESKELLNEARDYLSKRNLVDDRAGRRKTPRKTPKKRPTSARKMRRPRSAVALSRPSGKRKGGANNRRAFGAGPGGPRRSESTSGLLHAARGRSSNNKRNRRVDRMSVMRCVENALINVDDVIGLGNVKVQITKSNDIIVDAHILVDSRTTVKEAHKLATKARKRAMQSNTDIYDVVVHVDAQTRYISGRDSAEIEEDICSAMATIKEVSSVARVKINRKGGRIAANVEILVNPELRMREVHYVARRARKLVEDIRDVDEAEIHLELANSSKLVNRARSRARTGSASDKIVNGSYEKSASSPQTTTDEDLSQTFPRQPPPRPPMVDTSSHTDEEEYTYSEDEFETAPRSSKKENRGASASSNREKDPMSFISPERKYRAQQGGQTGAMMTPPRNMKAMSPASQHSARQSARTQRIVGITRDPRLRQVLRKVNEHILTSVQYRRFKYEKRLVAVGTALADMDRSGRGALPASVFVQGFEGLNIGLNLLEIENFVKMLVGDQNYQEDRYSVRFADIIDSLRKLQRQDADGVGSSTEDEEAQRDALTKYREYRNKIEEQKLDQVSESMGSPAKGRAAESPNAAEMSPLLASKTGAPRNKHLDQARGGAWDNGTPSPLLTHAEKAARVLENKMNDLQKEQQRELETAQLKLQEEQKELVARAAKFEAERKRQLEDLETEKKKALEEKSRVEKEAEERELKLAEEKIRLQEEAAERERQAKEESMREQLKKEWLAREQAQQRRLELEKEKRKKEQEEEKLRIEREKAALEKTRAEMERAKREWELKRVEEERKREEKAEREKLEHDKAELAKALEEQKQRLEEEKAKWEKQQALGVEQTRLKEERKRIEQEEAAREEHAELLRNERAAQEKLARRMEELEARLAMEEAEKKAIFEEQERMKDERQREVNAVKEEINREAAARIQAEKEMNERMAEEKAALQRQAEEDRLALEKIINESTKAREAEKVRQEEAEKQAAEERAQLEAQIKMEREQNEKEKALMQEQLRKELEEKMMLDAKRIASEETEAKLRAREEELAREQAEKEKALAEEARKKVEEMEKQLKQTQEKMKQQLAEKEKETERLKMEKMEQEKQVKQIAAEAGKVVLAAIPDTAELTPHVESSSEVQKTLFAADDAIVSMPPTGEKDDELSRSQNIRMRRLSRSITIETDTDLEEEGEVQNLEPPSNEVMIEHSYRIPQENVTTRGGETDRELESGDTFDENAMMPMKSFISTSAAADGPRKKWEPIATPQGKNLYWYNWSSGESQWEMPDEVANEGTQPKTQTLLAATPKADNLQKSSELWKILLARSAVVEKKGKWNRMMDQQTKEHFYHNEQTGVSQWDLPNNYSQGADGSFATPKKQTCVWEGIATPMGRNLYYYNWKTGESSWEKPEELKTPQNSDKKPRVLPSTPKAEDEGTSKQLWSVLLERSEKVKEAGEWFEMLDSNTKERFYYNKSTGALQWEVPDALAIKQERHLHAAKHNLIKSPKASAASIATTRDGKRWEPITTPKGKNLYYYDWHTGNSQWEKPDELKSPDPKQNHVLPSNSAVHTMTELSESQQLWDSLRTRSKTSRIQGDWLEMVDPHSQERFYYNTTNGTSQWEMPKLTGMWEASDKALQKANRSDVWEPVMTPKGRLLYYYNKTTGAAQRKIPEGFDPHTSSHGEHLPSTPNSSDVERTKRLWKVVLNRSRVVEVRSGWAQMHDDVTQEMFFHHSTNGISQWERPTDFDSAGAANDAQQMTYHGSPGEANKSKWQPVATPKGKNLYFWNSETGESQWERPAELPENKPAVSLGTTGNTHNKHEVLPSTPKAGNAVKAKKMWQVLRSRSKEIRVIGVWSEFLDEQTGEHFFYNSRSGVSQWELPESLKVAQANAKLHSSQHGNAGNDGGYEIDI